MSTTAVSMGVLVAVLSLNMTGALVGDGVVANTLPVIGATTSTPIVVTTGSPHGYARPVHGVVSLVGGMPEASGTWVLTPVPGQASKLSLFTYDAQGNTVNSVGAGTYTSGGQIQIAFPDGSILLGRRNVALSTAVAAPRVVFVPTNGKQWYLDGYGGTGEVAPVPNIRGTPEDRTQKLQRNIGTRYQTFEVYVTGCANPPDPDSGDFDAVLYLTGVLYGVLFDTVTPYGGHVLREFWPSQSIEAGSMTQRGQQWMGIVEFPMPLMDHPLQFVPIGTYMSLIVRPFGASGTSDDTVLIVT